MTGAKFEALGGKLEWTPGSTTEFLQQAIAARGDYVFDVVEVVEDLWSKWMGGGFVQKWDHSMLPNLSQLGPKMYDEYRVAPLDRPAIDHLQRGQVQGERHPGADEIFRPYPSQTEEAGRVP